MTLDYTEYQLFISIRASKSHMLTFLSGRLQLSRDVES